MLCSVELVLCMICCYASVCLVLLIFFFNDTATTEIYTYGHTLSLHDALPICCPWLRRSPDRTAGRCRDGTRRGSALGGRLGISPVVIGFTIAVTGSSALDLRLGSTLRFRVMASLPGGGFAGANTVSILLIQIGSTSCRERGWQEVEFTVVAG